MRNRARRKAECGFERRAKKPERQKSYGCESIGEITNFGKKIVRKKTQNTQI